MLYLWTQDCGWMQRDMELMQDVELGIRAFQRCVLWTRAHQVSQLLDTNAHASDSCTDNITGKSCINI